MKKSKFAEAQVAAALRECASGAGRTGGAEARCERADALHMEEAARVARRVGHSQGA